MNSYNIMSVSVEVTATLRATTKCPRTLVYIVLQFTGRIDCDIGRLIALGMLDVARKLGIANIPSSGTLRRKMIVLR